MRNLITLERLANTLSADTEARLQAVFREIANDLQIIDPGAPVQRTYQQGRLKELIARVQSRLRAWMKAEEAASKASLAAVARVQGVWAGDTLTVTLGSKGRRVRPTPMSQQWMRTILNEDPLQGRLFREHIGKIGQNAYDRLRTQVRMGLLAEEPISDIVRRIRGKQVRRGVFSGGVLDTTTREAEALARTAVNHVANRAMLETYQANSSILLGVRFVSVLDDRTTVLCASLDGTVWPMGSDEIRQPPLHYNCRSLLVPEVDWERLGLPAPPETPRSARDLSDVSEEDLRRRVSARRRTGDFGSVTQVSSSTTAEQWLRRQPNHVQDKMLGRGKAELFRAGKMTLSDFVRQDGRVIPLRELLGAA